MTIRSKLSIAMVAMFGMLLLTTGVVIHAVRTISAQVISHASLRELSVFTDDVRAEIFYRMAVNHGFGPLRAEEDWWPDDVLEDVNVRVRLAADEVERAAWSQVRDAVATLAAMSGDDPQAVGIVRDADTDLRKLRRFYDRQVATAVARTADAASTAQLIAVGAALVSALLSALMMLFIRDWLVRPVEALTRASEEIGAGNLAYRVPLRGSDELAQLARRLDTMAERLGDHQKMLVESRELAAIGELCTNVAHGLRNPLAGMRAGAQLAARGAEGSPPLKSMLDDIVQEIDRMDARISQLFEFSRIGAVERLPTRFAELIDAAENESRGVATARGIRLIVDDRTSDTVWPMDQAKLASAMGELIANAAHHSDPGADVVVTGSVTTSVNGTPMALSIRIADRGCGIHPNAMSRLFDLFYTTRPGGTGMGLPMARRIIEQHGGTIEIESTPGEGTRVEVRLTVE